MCVHALPRSFNRVSHAQAAFQCGRSTLNFYPFTGKKNTTGLLWTENILSFFKFIQLSVDGAIETSLMTVTKVSHLVAVSHKQP